MELFLNADAIEILAELSPATRHKVMDAAVHYCKTGEMPAKFTANVMAVFKSIIALSKATTQQAERTEAAPDASGTPRKKRDYDKEIVKKSLKTICGTFTWPQYMTDSERREEQVLMVKVRDAVMNRYDSLRPHIPTR